jgi:serine/threonine-protein kinase
LIEVDRAERWRRGHRVSAEHYLNAFPELRSDVEAALVVIYGEFFLRKDFGESPTLLEYIARFPQHARRLRDQVMWHEAIEFGPPSSAGPPTIPGLVVGELIGRGGMCSVFRAADETTGEDVAVKMLDPAHRAHPVRVARFSREVGSLTRLSHPHIVKAIRTGEAGGLPFLVMEYCPNGTLAGRRLEPTDAAAVLGVLADAVEYAHGQGVVHRDLKPANVLLARDRRPKIADFGLAKCAAELGGSLTATRDGLGTPCYMAPELATGARDADARTDVYGLGAILYELLTGRPPFVGVEPLEVVRMVREEPPTPPTVINPNVPAELEAVCLRCLEKEPGRRYPSAAGVAVVLGSPPARR